MLKVVHYLNQFFGGIGGEEKAEAGLQILEGAKGPGNAFNKVLGEKGEIVATLISGDNYFAENIEKAAAEALELLAPYQPDLIIAGPAFNAGRYGIACGGICQAVSKQLKIPAVTGMYEENPGLDLYRQDLYIVPTADSVKGMNAAVSNMVQLAWKLCSNQKIGAPSLEGYFPRGALVNEISDQNGAERAVDMLIKKLTGQPFTTEVVNPNYDIVSPAPHISDLSRAKIALVTDGGLVPKGNPDQVEMRTASRFGKYAFKGQPSLLSEDYEVSHVGYDSVYVRDNPNRLVPVDILRDLEKEGMIGQLHEEFYSTTGVANIVETVRQMGQKMAEGLKADGVSGVILTST